MIDLVRTRSGVVVAAVAVLASFFLLTACPSASVAPPTPTGTPTRATPTASAAATATPRQEAPTPMPPGPNTPSPKQETPTPAPVAPTPPGTPPAVATPHPQQAQCPNLESRLFGLSTADDPAAYARTNGIYYANGNTRAVIELKGADDALPTGYDITVEGRQSNLVQALVPVRDLCRLSNEPQVRFVRVPFEAGR